MRVSRRGREGSGGGEVVGLCWLRARGDGGWVGRGHDVGVGGWELLVTWGGVRGGDVPGADVPVVETLVFHFGRRCPCFEPISSLVLFWWLWLGKRKKVTEEKPQMSRPKHQAVWSLPARSFSSLPTTG